VASQRLLKRGTDWIRTHADLFFRMAHKTAAAGLTPSRHRNSGSSRIPRAYFVTFRLPASPSSSSFSSSLPWFASFSSDDLRQGRVQALRPFLGSLSLRSPRRFGGWHRPDEWRMNGRSGLPPLRVWKSSGKSPATIFRLLRDGPHLMEFLQSISILLNDGLPCAARAVPHRALRYLGSPPQPSC
jgi:hypothetical protein